MSSSSQHVERRSKGSFLRFFKSRPTRKAFASIADASAATSAFLPADSHATSAGASQNSAELLRHLDAILLELGEDGHLSMEADNVADRLWEATERYANCFVPDGLPDWKCSVKEAQLIKLAAHASYAMSRNPTNLSEIEQPETQTGRFTLVKDISASQDGSIKAASLTYVSDEETPSHSTLFLAIRGSATVMDWMVNANADAVDADKEFLPYPTNDNQVYRSHKGFLGVAMRMAPRIRTEIISFLDQTAENSSTDLVLTGHSAGGGVVSLIFAHLLLCCPNICERLRYVHYITFGAPPVFSSPSLNARLADLQQNTGSISGQATTDETMRPLFVTIATQGDVVPRGDKAYIHSLVELYARTNIADVEPETKREWVLPHPELTNAGMVVVARDTQADSEETNWKFSIVSQSVLQNLVWGNVKAHKMGVYVRAVRSGL